ncbi:hypothetical protein [Nocardioides sp. WS12]|uniref:hypothetical protein n=1 Tax=Nocardioides sp. WS12 TaxID=2486272 RepID=UPI0015FCC3B5|nr:hypothetical protein [Nocardioides sp. WS12]
MSIRGWDPPAAPQLRPSPEPTPSRALPIAIALTVALLLGSAVVAAMAFYHYASTDHLGVLDDPDVVEAIDIACSRMEESVRASAPLPNDSATAVAAAMRNQNTAITAMIGDIRSIGTDKLAGDHPAEAWLADWEILIDLREAYADALTRGERPVLTVPMTDGLPITTRMDDAADCRVAAALAKPPLPRS